MPPKAADWEFEKVSPPLAQELIVLRFDLEVQEGFKDLEALELTVSRFSSEC